MKPISVPAVEYKGVWKIFGARAKEALHAIRADGLSKNDVLETLDCVVGVANASFAVQEGEIFCIMGLSGSGKSTLLRHVNRLIDPTTGQIFIEGEDISHKSEEEMRRIRAEKIGMVFQNMALLPHRTVRQNVAFGLEIRHVEKPKRLSIAEEKLALVGLDGWGDRYPDELSGGMQQRVGLARATAADPKILLMDEPFSALDPLIRRQLQEQFLELAAVMKKTTLFITHDLDEAIRLGNRIAIMKDGMLVQIGTPEDIITKPADDYVADFVAGISRLKFVFAHTVMESLRPSHENLTDAPRTHESSDLNTLIHLAVDTDKPIVITDGGGKDIGIVTKRALLRGLQGER